MDAKRDPLYLYGVSETQLILECTTPVRAHQSPKLGFDNFSTGPTIYKFEIYTGLKFIFY